ncbi:MAG: hypothetical protein QF719_07300 [Chloroflexota bacterium]|nr:hypothetical protein [Chloroflexota bacterium]MDP6758004.1 hypothetical protein [Chloroflexota bacterium]
MRSRQPGNARAPSGCQALAYLCREVELADLAGGLDSLLRALDRRAAAG